MMQLRTPRVTAEFLSALLVVSMLMSLQQSHAQSSASAPAASQDSPQRLKYVVIISRHGVRSPTDKIGALNQYSAKPWPQWSVPPGYLTEHGAKLMTLFGAYDRELFAKEGLFAAQGCADAAQVSVIADSDQRTRETGKALAAGMFPGCNIDVKALAEGTHDPLFHSLEAGVGHGDKAVATASIAGRIGNNPAGLAEAYRPQLQVLEEVLLGCKPGPACAAAHSSLFDIPSSISPGKGDHLVDLRGPLGTAATMAENLLLEYTEGMDASQVGWGRVDANKLRELMQLHTANAELERRTSYIAVAGSSNLLRHILDSMQRAASGRPVAGALGKPEDRLLILVGHDTNLSNVSGALGLTWLIDGRLDDTPPGGALMFELWQDRQTGEYSVRTSYTAQTIEQMRSVASLSTQNPPERVPVFVPGCSQADDSCRWNAFQQAIHAGTEAEFER
jgi:4-phytase/acid phosphatase